MAKSERGSEKERELGSQGKTMAGGGLFFLKKGIQINNGRWERDEPSLLIIRSPRGGAPVREARTEFLFDCITKENINLLCECYYYSSCRCLLLLRLMTEQDTPLVLPGGIKIGSSPSKYDINLQRVDANDATRAVVWNSDLQCIVLSFFKRARAHGTITTISHHACQSNINKKKTMLACLARLHGVSLLCTRLVNDRPLSSSQAVWAEYELMHCNMTVITPWWASCAPRPFHILFWVQSFPTSFCASYHLFSSLTILYSCPLCCFCLFC